MKAARERLTKPLTVSTQVAVTKEVTSRREIRECTEAEVHCQYRLGARVQASTNIGMDVVFATRLRDHTEVVVKTRKKPSSFKSNSEEREWRNTTVYQMNMPKISTLCEVYEVLETDDCYYVVMEKVEGKDLFEILLEENLSAGDAREIVKQILDGLKALHHDGRIHKDLKIENVMVDLESPRFSRVRRASVLSSGSCPEVPDSDGEVKLIDFDTVQDWSPKSPLARDVLGSDGYIAPEAYTGDYSPASDIYAVGVIMYKLMTGTFPLRPEIFDDAPGENYVGSPAMKRIRDRLRLVRIDYEKPPLNKIPEAADLLRRMLAFHVADRPTADEASRHAFFALEFDEN